jgi:hypothetical protein
VDPSRQLPVATGDSRSGEKSPWFRKSPTQCRPYDYARMFLESLFLACLFGSRGVLGIPKPCLAPSDKRSRSPKTASSAASADRSFALDVAWLAPPSVPRPECASQTNDFVHLTHPYAYRVIRSPALRDGLIISTIKENHPYGSHQATNTGAASLIVPGKS